MFRDTQGLYYAENWGNITYVLPTHGLRTQLTTHANSHRLSVCIALISCASMALCMCLCATLCSVAVWLCNSVAVWLCGSMALRLFCSVARWLRGCVAPLLCGSAALMLYEFANMSGYVALLLPPPPAHPCTHCTNPP